MNDWIKTFFDARIKSVSKEVKSFNVLSHQHQEEGYKERQDEGHNRQDGGRGAEKRQADDLQNAGRQPAGSPTRRLTVSSTDIWHELEGTHGIHQADASATGA
jgi:hypothetical protein